MSEPDGPVADAGGAMVEPSADGVIRLGKTRDKSEPGSKGLRTDPKSFIALGLKGLQNLVLPLVLLTYTTGIGKYGIFAIVGIVAVVATFAFAMAYLAWYRLTYLVGKSDIRVESGIISRQARSVPFDRIQDVSIEQSLIPRLLGLVEVKFETGAGGKDELALAYLSEEQGERLREVVRELRDDVGLASEAGAAIGAENGDGLADTDAEPLFAMDKQRVLTFGVFEFSLAIVAAFFALVQQFEILLPFDIFDFDAWQELLAGPGDRLAGMGAMAQMIGGLVAFISLLLVGLLTGLIRTTLREWGFTLHRTAKGFRRRRGLLTRTDVVMPVHRVQALKIATGFIRRRFGWHSLKLVSLAQDSGNASHEAAPFAQMEEIAPIIKEAGFAGVSEDLDWQRGSRKFGKDSAFFAAIFIVLFAVIVAGVMLSGLFTGLDYGAWLVAGLLALSALVAAWEMAAWRRRRHAITDTQLFFRRGILSPKIDIANRTKLQSVEISQGPIAQKRGYATLNLGLAGGSLALEGLPLPRAQELRRALLDSMTATDFSELNRA